MRKYLVSLLIIPIALVFIPLGLGFTAQNFVSNDIEKIPMGKGYAFKVANFKRGWFSSTAEIMVEITNPSIAFIANAQTGRPAPLVLMANMQIKHGLFMLDNSDPANTSWHFGRLMFNAPLALASNNPDTADLAKMINNQPLIKVWGKQNLFGSIDLRLNTPAINYKDSQGTVVWNGISSQIEVSDNNKHIQANIVIEPVDLKITEAGYLKTSTITISTDSRRSEHGLWLGENTLKVADFDAMSAKRNHLTFNTLNAVAKTDSQKQTIDAHINADINKFSINDASYGPMHLEYELANLDEAAVAALRDYSDKLPKDVGVMANLDQTLVKEQIEKLLARGPEMEVKNFQLQSDKGNFSLNAKLAVDQKTQQNPNQTGQNWTNQIDAVINMRAAPAVSRKIVSVAYLGSLGSIAQFIALAPNADKGAIDAMIDKEAQKILDQLTEQKYLVLNDNQYNLNFTFKNGTALINGQAVPNIMKNPAPGAAPAVNAVPNASGSQPGVNQPSVNQPSVNQPSVNQPGVNQPSVNQPGVIQPGQVVSGTAQDQKPNPQQQGNKP